MEWVRMWVLAWVVSGWCVDVSMGAVRAVWAVEGCGVSSTDEHPPPPALACLLPACACLVWSGPTDVAVVPVRTHEPSFTTVNPSSASRAQC